MELSLYLYPLLRKISNMEYKKIGATYYVRMDRDDEIISNILDICRKESIPSAIFSGIGYCWRFHWQKV